MYLAPKCIYICWTIYRALYFILYTSLLYGIPKIYLFLPYRAQDCTLYRDTEIVGYDPKRACNDTP